MNFQLDSIKWPTIAFLGTASLAFGIYFLVKHNKKEKEAKKYQQEQDEELNKAIKQQQPTISELDALNKADKLYVAMKGPGTKEDVIYQVFSGVNNRTDILLIENKFGLRKNETLTQWLIDDLNKNELQKLNKIIADKGINYQF